MFSSEQLHYAMGRNYDSIVEIMDYLMAEGICLESEYDEYLDVCPRVLLTGVAYH